MKAPQLTEQYFKDCKDLGVVSAEVKTISALNAKGCRKNFTTRVPTLEGEKNAHLVILNHKGRWFYAPMQISTTVPGGRLIIVDNPCIIWTGYVIFEGKIYPVTGSQVNRGFITPDMEISIDEVET